MQFECDMAFARTEIICHGARAQRIGERIFRNTCKYLKSTDFVKGNISDKEREKMIDSISLVGLINMPEDLEKIDKGCDIVFQIVLDDDKQGLQMAKKIREDNAIPNITFIIGETENELDIPHIKFNYSGIHQKAQIDIANVFIDLFSVYTLPQEYGADFEELRPLFENKGEIYLVSGQNLYKEVLKNYIKYALIVGEGEIYSPSFENIKGESSIVLASRKSFLGEGLQARGYMTFKKEPCFDYDFEKIVNDVVNGNGLYAIYSCQGFGKTTLALQLLSGVLDKKGGRALILSQEMLEKTMIERASCFIDKDKIIVSDDATLIYDTPYDLVSEYIKENSDISVVLVDPVFWSTSKSLQDYKRINKDYKIPVLLTATLPRNSGDNMPRNLPTLSDLVSFSSLEQDIDYIIFLHRDHQAIRGIGTRENRNVGKSAELIVAKNRYGEKDVVAKAYWNEEKLQFEFD